MSILLPCLLVGAPAHISPEGYAMRALLVLVVGGIALLVGACALFAKEDESWRLPLAEKARLIEQSILERHNILGLYPSQVEVPLDGSPVDNTITGISNIAHSIVWTSYYLEGACYRYAFLKRSGAPADQVAQARARADEIFESIYRCQLVTGVRGLQARGYFPGHGPAYEEREDAGTRDEWHQGTGEFADYRWRADPSHHNYSSSAHAICQYYDLAAEGPQRERAREALDALVSYWLDNDYLIYNYGRPEPAVPILGFTDGKTLNTRVLMVLGALKAAAHVTGKQKYAQAYDRLTRQYGVRTLKGFRTEKDHDDAQHDFCHLEVLFRLEQDPELRAGYRKVLDGLWANHRGDAQSLFTYIYYSAAPDAPGREQALAEALHSLQTWPTDSTLRPRMSSLRPELGPPYPVYAAAWDNEYHWKGSLLGPDGWLSRIVTGVATSPEDLLVVYACDEIGDLYRSQDGGATAAGWVPVDQRLTSPVRALDVGRRSRLLAVACDDGFHLSTTGGESWARLPVPEDGGKPVDIRFEHDHPVLYAVTTLGVYRSQDFGEQYLGQAWEALTAGIPPAKTRSFRLAPGRLWALLDGALWTRSLNQGAWESRGPVGIPHYAPSTPWLAVDPSQPDHLLVGVRFGHEPFGTQNLVQQSVDGGRTWTNTETDLRAALQRGGLAAVMKLALPGEMGEVVISPRNPKLVFAAADRRGVLKSSDGGKTWAERRAGLDIPLVKSVFAPPHGDWVWAGTPAGLFVSRDGGDHWEDANLCLQFRKNTRREIGSGSYLDAYWRARYYGFTDEAAATQPYQGN